METERIMIVLNYFRRRRALRDHIEKLSIGNDFPSHDYLEYDISGKFAKLYGLALADSLGSAILCLMLLNTIKDLCVFIAKLFR